MAGIQASVKPGRFSRLVILISALALAVSAQNKIRVNFENSAYGIGDNYDRDNQAKDWDLIGTNLDDGGAVITNDESASGSRSLAISYPANAKAVRSSFWRLEGSKTYYLQYKVRFADDFTFNGQGGKNGGKLPGLGAAKTGNKYQVCSGCEPCSTGNGFSARLMWRTDGVGVLYMYDVSKTVACGEDIYFKNGKKFKRGVWHTITQRVTLNDNGKGNGQIQVYLDDDEVIDIKGRKIVGAGELVDRMLFTTFFGGNDLRWYPTSEQTAYFDDFVVSVDAGDVGL